MECEQVRTLLGPFHDRELASAEHAAVAAHVGECAACAGELAAITELGESARLLPAPHAPESVWLDVADRMPARRRSPWKVAAVAAVVLVAVAAGWLTRRTPSAPDLELVALGAGRPVALQDAARQVDFRFVSRTELAGGYRLDECCLCSDGCCDMVRCKYRRGSDRIVLVQGPAAHPVDFGDRPSTEETVGGKRVCVIRCEGCLAATWRTGDTSFSLIGPRDLPELSRLLAAVDESR